MAFKSIMLIIMAIFITGCGGGSSDNNFISTNSFIDVRTPQIIQRTPYKDQDDANATDKISFIFDRDITAVEDKRFQIFEADSDALHTEINVTDADVNGDEVSVNPSYHLAYGKTHYIKIDEGAFVDAQKNSFEGINNSNEWRFTVASGSGPCGCDDFDNSDLPANLQ